MIKIEKNNQQENPLSGSSIGKAVLKDTLTHNLTLWPLSVSFLSLISAILIDPLWGFLAVASFSLGTGVWIYNFFFRGDYFAKKYIENLQNMKKKEEENKINFIVKKLSELEDKKICKDFAKRAKLQFNYIQEKVEQLKKLLEERFDFSDINYLQLIDNIKELHSNSLENLHLLINQLESITLIDVEYIDSRLTELSKSKKREISKDKEREILLKRKELLNNQLEEVNNYIIKNEEIITELDKILIEISKIQKGASEGNLDINQELEDINNLLKSLQKESTKNI